MAEGVKEELAALEKYCQEQFANGDRQFVELRDQQAMMLDRQEKLVEATTKLTNAVTKLTEDTSAIVELHRNWQGAARIGKSLQDFLMWLTKFSFFTAGIAAAVWYLLDRFAD